MHKKLKIIAAISFSLVMSGCATNSGNGAMIGAVAGAIAAKATGNHDSKRMIWGAALGTIAGAGIGQYMDKQEEDFRRELAGSGIGVEREGDNLRLVMPSNITFSTGQSAISSSFNAVLHDVARVLSRYDKTLLSIEGHTDSTGNEISNQVLSEQRAESVKSYFVHKNIAMQRLKTVGYGESMPVASNGTASGRSDNRRVEIQIIPNKK